MFSKKILYNIMLLFVCISLQTMEERAIPDNQASKTQVPKTILTFNFYLEKLPIELLEIIIFNIIKESKNFDSTIRNLKAAKRAFAKIYKVPQMKNFTVNDIKSIARKFNINPLILAKNLSVDISSKSKEQLEKIFLSIGSLTDKRNFQDENGDTDLIKAARVGAIKTVEQLIKNGADLNIQNKYGNTALLEALKQYKILPPCYNQQQQEIEYLLKSGANPNIKNNEKNTALHLMLKTNFFHYSIIKLLLRAGANPNKKNYRQQSPITIAQKKGYEKILQLFNLQKAKLHLLNEKK